VSPFLFLLNKCWRSWSARIRLILPHRNGSRAWCGYRSDLLLLRYRSDKTIKTF
jgi:hypothetical protein